MFHTNSAECMVSCKLKIKGQVQNISRILRVFSDLLILSIYYNKNKKYSNQSNYYLYSLKTSQSRRLSMSKAGNDISIFTSQILF